MSLLPAKPQPLPAVPTFSPLALKTSPKLVTFVLHHTLQKWQ
jgi:hypothetical protein